MSNKQQFENFKSALDAKTEIPKRKFLKKTLKNILGVLTDFPFVFTPVSQQRKVSVRHSKTKAYLQT